MSIFSIPDILPTLTYHMCQWAANDGPGLAKTLLQAVFHVRLARVDLNCLSIQRWNFDCKGIQNA